jgi:hypothetical protein
LEKGIPKAAYCVEMETIEKAAPYFKEVMEEDVVRQERDIGLSSLKSKAVL